jgi:DCN1-like protein 1/2
LTQIERTESEYANDPSAVDAIDAESCQSYVERLNANPLSYDLFVVLDIVQAETLGQITRSGFVDGWARVMTENKESVPKEKKQAKSEEEERQRLWSLQEQFVRYRINQALTDPSYFKSLYDLAFQIGREPPQKALNMMLAVAFWEALYDPETHPWRSAKVNWLQSWTSFLKEKFGVTGVNEDGEVEVVDYKRTVSKDLWTQLRLFVVKTMEDETLSFWSEEQAWPGLVDEFVLWCREKGVVGTQNGEAMEVEE